MLKKFSLIELSNKELNTISGGADLPPLTADGHLEGNSLDKLEGIVRIQANIPATDNVYIQPAIAIDGQGNPRAGGVRVTILW